MRTLEFTVADVPAPEEYVRRVTRAMAKSSLWIVGNTVVLSYRAFIAARIALAVLATHRCTRRLELMLATRGGHCSREELAALLHSYRETYSKVLDLQRFVLSEGQLSALEPTIVWLLDEYLLVVDDAVETLELCVDPEVRNHIADEIHIADSGSSDAHLQTSA